MCHFRNKEDLAKGGRNREIEQRFKSHSCTDAYSVKCDGVGKEEIGLTLFFSYIGIKSTELCCGHQEESLLSCAKANRIFINNETQYLEIADVTSSQPKSREVIELVIGLPASPFVHTTHL